MRKTIPMKMGDLWEDFLKNSPNVARKIAEAKVSEAWPSVVGPMATAYTQSIDIVNGVLTARISSAACRSELFMQRDALRDALNREAGMKVINVVLIK